jgi:LemA protein
MTVRDLNIKVQTFPSSVIANQRGITKRDFFELDEAGDREVPTVSFGTAPAAGA